MESLWWNFGRIQIVQINGWVMLDFSVQICLIVLCCFWHCPFVVPCLLPDMLKYNYIYLKSQLDFFADVKLGCIILFWFSPRRSRRRAGCIMIDSIKGSTNEKFSSKRQYSCMGVIEMLLEICVTASIVELSFRALDIRILMKKTPLLFSCA